MSQKGFTLAEVLVSTVLTMLVLLGIYEFTISTKRIYVSQTEWASMDQQGRVAMDTLVRAIRRAGSDPLEQAFDLNVANSIPIPMANRYAIRVLADLPQDTMNDAGSATPDGDDFDIFTDDDALWENNENENGDGALLPANADPEEDILFCLTPSDSSYVPTGSGPWTLVKRVPVGGGATVDIPVAENVITGNGQPGLELRYILRMVSGIANIDLFPTPFQTRWAGVSGTGVAANSSSYTALNDKRSITRVLVRLTLRSQETDRTTGVYRYITFESDIDVRVLP